LEEEIMDHQAFAQMLGNYGEFVGAIAVVATLFYLAVQVRHSKNATEANTRSLEQSQEIAMNDAGFNVAKSHQEFANAIIPHADIWIRGNAGEPLDHVEAEIYASFIMARWATAFWGAHAMNKFHDLKDVGIHDFSAFLSQNPGAQATWEESNRAEQEYRDRLLDKPGGAGADQVQMVLEDLEKLRNDSSDVVTNDDR
jgi:hypothetical protein